MVKLFRNVEWPNLLRNKVKTFEYVTEVLVPSENHRISFVTKQKFKVSKFAFMTI